jgi:predicted amidophosphoribosyltransferase
MGLMMPAMFAQYFAGGMAPADAKDTQATTACPECKADIPVKAKFCPSCGHQLLIFTQCASCGKNLTPGAKFCPRCGHAVEKKPLAKFCSKCGTENLNDAMFCNQCGEKL